MCFRMDRGVTRLLGFHTIQGKTQAQDCKHFVLGTVALLTKHSFQRLYFRNANHPISRPSVTTRRHERMTISEQSRVQEADAERR